MLSLDRGVDDELGQYLGDKGTRPNVWRAYHRKLYKGKSDAELAAGNVETERGVSYIIIG